MGGFWAGIISVMTALVGVAALATVMKNPSGAGSLVTSSANGFATVLGAAEGNSSGFISPTMG